jgi:hypothetical protein
VHAPYHLSLFLANKEIRLLTGELSSAIDRTP